MDSFDDRMPIMQKPLRVLLLALLLVSIPLISSAQSTTEIVLSAPDTSSYPQIQAFLKVRTDDGRFVPDLSPSDIVMIENGEELELDSLEEQAPGVQIAIGIDPTPAFAVRDSTGTSRYGLVVEALNSWISSQENRTQDVLSLIMTGNDSAFRMETYRELGNALDALPTDHRNASSNIKTLSDAINTAGDFSTGPGKGRAVFYITPEVNNDTLGTVESLTAIAIQNDVSVFVWMVTSEAYFQTNGANALREMAEATGGRMYAFSGTETLPDPEDYFDALRRIYSLTYSSAVRSSGEYELSARITKAGVESTSQPSRLNLVIQPPNPIFVSPPDDIYRSLVPDAEGNLSADRRTPENQSIDILIEFPDGYPRELVRSTLYVDGQIVAENTEPPFDQFDWSLKDIGASGRFTLQVEALDSLGLSSISLDTPVNITVQRLPEGLVPAISQNSPLVVTVVVLLVGAVLIFVLLRFRRLRPETLAVNGNGRKTKPRPAADPVYQTVETEAKTIPTDRLSRWTNRLQWPQRNTPRGEPIAYLERIYNQDSLEALTPIPPYPIYSNEVTLGNDPNQATIVLEELTVAALHARVHQNANREFFVSDIGSVSGTYVNYLPTNGSQTRLEHGDQVHFGTVGFRFRLNPPPQLSLPTIIDSEETSS